MHYITIIAILLRKADFDGKYDRRYRIQGDPIKMMYMPYEDLWQSKWADYSMTITEIQIPSKMDIFKKQRFSSIERGKIFLMKNWAKKKRT